MSAARPVVSRRRHHLSSRPNASFASGRACPVSDTYTLHLTQLIDIPTSDTLLPTLASDAVDMRSCV